MNLSRIVDKAHASLHFLRFPKVCEQSVHAKCLKCSSDLILHQPDMNLPERLLGVCESCKHWHLIDFVSGAEPGVMVMLPDLEVVLEIAHRNPTAGISMTIGQPEGAQPAAPSRTELPKSSP